MVSPEDGDARGVSNFEGNKESDGFDGVVTTINIVTYAVLDKTPVRGIGD